MQEALRAETATKRNSLIRIIDAINEWTGKIFCGLVIFIVIFQVTEIVLRRVFDSPTTWAWTVNGQIFTFTAILGGGYCLLHDGHVKLDLLYNKVGPRVRVVFTSIWVPLILVAFAVIVWQSGIMVWKSFQSHETGYNIFAPVLWPVKSSMLLGSILLLFQIIAYYIRFLTSIRNQTETKSEGNN